MLNFRVIWNGAPTSLVITVMSKAYIMLLGYKEEILII